MKRIKAIVYGIGVIGKLATKYMAEGGIDIVGAIDVNPDIVGKDLGEVAELGRLLNLKVSDDADKILFEQEADIAVVSIFSQMDRMYPLFEKCIINGLNVVTPSEEALYPWETAPEWAARLDKLAKKYGVTLTGGGLQDTFRVNMVSLITGASHTIESITGMEKVDLVQSGPVALANFHIGETKNEFYKNTKGKVTLFNSFKITLHAIIADLGLTIGGEEQSAEPVTDDMDVEAKNFSSGIVKKGLITGMTKIINIETKEGIKFRGEQTFKAYNKEEKTQGYAIEWIIKGIPTIHIRSNLTEIEPKSGVVAQMIYRIPDVINSEPGLITIEKLPKLKFRAFPLHYYLE